MKRSKEEDKEKDKEENKKKIKKKKYGELKHVLLSDVEYKKLIDKFGEKETLDWIKRLDEGIDLKGYSYKSHYRAILNWKEKSNDRPQRLA